MKKNKFLRELASRLELLNPDDITEIIEEYKGYILEKQKSGMSEIDAVASFGDIDELAEEILLPYRIRKKKENDPIGDFAQKIFKTCEKIIYDLMHKDTKDIIRFVIELLILLLFIAFLHLPVSLLVSFGKDIFDILTSPLNRIFFSIWKWVLEFSYILLAVITFGKIFHYRYLKKENEKQENNSPKQQKKVFEEEAFKKSPILTISEFFIKVFVVCLKFLAILVLFGTSIYLIGMALVLGICAYLLLQGVTYLGIYIIMISMFFLGAIFFSLLFNFVIDNETKSKYLWQFMFTFLLLGVGCTFTTFEVAVTEFINRPPADIAMEKLTEELIMKKDTVFIGNISNYQVDDTVENIKVIYEYYPLGTRMSTKISKKDEFVYLNWDLETVHLDKEFLMHMVNDLKEKKIYNYYIEPTITIVANEEKIELIKKNRQKYYQSETNYQSCQFTRTYTVEMLKKAQTEDVYSVVLSQYLEDDLVTIHLSKELAHDLKVSFSYEFTFKTYQAYLDTDIETIFEENEVVGVKYTEKKGIEQIQDHNCTIFY